MIKKLIFLCSIISIPFLTAITDNDKEKYLKNNYPILCSNLKPIEELNISQLSGSWLTLQIFILKQGFPIPITVNNSNQNRQNPQCVRVTVYNATGSGLTATTDVKIGDERRTFNSTIIINDQSKPGVWDLQTRYPTYYIPQLLVLAAIPKEYLVLASCDLIVNTTEPNFQTANFIKIFSRGNGLPARELITLHKDLMRILQVNELDPNYFENFNIKC